MLCSSTVVGSCVVVFLLFRGCVAVVCCVAVLCCCGVQLCSSVVVQEIMLRCFVVLLCCLRGYTSLAAVTGLSPQDPRACGGGAAAGGLGQGQHRAPSTPVDSI